MDNILINEEEMKNTISKLDEEISKLESIYNDIDNKMKEIDENSDIFSGDVEKTAYDYYLKISSGFPNSINQMKSLKVFLENTLSNYMNSDQKLNKSIEDNKDNLEIK